VEIAGGSVGVVSEVIDNATLPSRAPVMLRKARLGKILGIELADAAVSGIFQRLGMQVETSAEGWLVTPPGFRFDIQIEADLIEEIARIVGYNNLPNSSLLMRSELGKAPEATLPLERVQDLLVDKGYQEAITYSFVDEEIQALIAPNQAVVRLQNPISSELSVMRTSLWCGLLRAALYNTNRQQNRVRLFETGLRFVLENGVTQQQKMLAGLALGSVNTEQWGEKTRKVDFFDVKADVEALSALISTPFCYTAATHPALHPGQSAQISTACGEAVGWIGMLHPTLEKQLGFDSPVFLFELAQEVILQRQVPRFSPLSKFPSVRRDMALIVKEEISVQQLIDCINSCQQPAIQKIMLFDIYRGTGIESGYKSVALSLLLQDFSQTLTDSQIDAIFSTVLDTLTRTTGAKLRD
jgi:phenylalanyl-tRNA synthetase beta chain